MFGGNNPIHIQSMTTTDTMDTEGNTVMESIRMIEAGCKLVRITALNKKVRQSTSYKRSVKSKRVFYPIVADIHYTQMVKQNCLTEL